MLVNAEVTNGPEDDINSNVENIVNTRNEVAIVTSFCIYTFAEIISLCIK